jgi:hypothetical protein
MKKLIGLFAIAALAFAVVGCSAPQDQAANTESTTTTTAPSDTNATTGSTEGATTGAQENGGTAPAGATEGEKSAPAAGATEGESK